MSYVAHVEAVANCLRDVVDCLPLTEMHGRDESENVTLGLYVVSVVTL